jgi:hypothetical protein
MACNTPRDIDTKINRSDSTTSSQATLSLEQ